MSRSRCIAACLSVVVLGDPPLCAAESPEVLRFQTQQAGDTTYFRVALRRPADMHLPSFAGWESPATEARRHYLALLPQLIPQDDRASAVCCTRSLRATDDSRGDLEFVGKLNRGRAHFLLRYPTARTPSEKDGKSLAPLLAWQTCKESLLTLDVARAERLRPFAKPRDKHAGLDPADLEGQWAAARVRQLDALGEQASDAGFFNLARTLTERKYRVQVPAPGRDDAARREKVARALYETTTGAASLTASLALDRLLAPTAGSRNKRTIEVNDIAGIDVPEHPWKQMMGDKKPAEEPLAGLVPHDHYYVTFKSIRGLLELGDWLDEWGGNILAGYELASRDYGVRPRYQKQLCLESTALARTLGPALIRGVAVTGSDPYVREGSDVSVIFHVNSRRLLLAALEPHIQAARKEHGTRLRETKTEYQGDTVESFVTPLREVSLHRAAVGEYVICSNSLAALHRILDTHAGRRKALVGSLDFQYMRTVFRRDDPQEDGFAFIPDTFIRRLVGPASKIKEKRRLEALGGLTAATNAALFVGWETGKLPADHEAMLAASGLPPESLDVPEGKAVRWDGKQKVAVSDVYNTLAFATPLIEVPIDKVTEAEGQEYRQFRQEYLTLWRRYFDPMGFRFSLSDKRLRVETYILPVIASSGYAELANLTGRGTATLDLSALSPRTLVHFAMRLDPEHPFRGYFRRFGKDPLGDCLFLRWDDGPAYRKLAELQVRREWEQVENKDLIDLAPDAFLQMPLTFGVRLGDPKVFQEVVAPMLWQFLGCSGSGDVQPLYKGVSVTRRKGSSDSPLFRELGGRKEPVLYEATIDGTWYLSLSADALREQIDRAVARKEGRLKEGEKAEFNSSLYLAPEAACEAADALRAFLEWQTYRRAVGNGPVWYALLRSGAVTDCNSEESRQAALRLLGYVPVSPDGSKYHLDRRTDDVLNARHGSRLSPSLHAAIDDASPLAKLLGQLRTVRADLRFREDGIHTILTIDRRPPAK
jgi:hypothetical protein